MTTTTHLKPGEIVQHPKKGRGYVLGYGSNLPGRIRIIYADPKASCGYKIDITNFTGWERVDICTWRERQWLDYRGGVRCTCDTYPETTSGPEEDCEIHGRPYSEWAERAAEAEAKLALAESTPTAAEAKPTSATLTLFCPECGEELPERRAWVTSGPFDGKWVTFDPNAEVHTCQPSQPDQPDEPTEFGAKVFVTLDGGKIERFISCGDGWVLTNPSAPNLQSQPWHWDYLIECGTVSLGWGDES